MKRHHDNPAVLAYGFETIANLSINPDNQIAVAAAGGIQVHVLLPRRSLHIISSRNPDCATNIYPSRIMPALKAILPYPVLELPFIPILSQLSSSNILATRTFI